MKRLITFITIFAMLFTTNVFALDSPLPTVPPIAGAHIEEVCKVLEIEWAEKGNFMSITSSQHCYELHFLFDGFSMLHVYPENDEGEYYIFNTAREIVQVLSSLLDMHLIEGIPAHFELIINEVDSLVLVMTDKTTLKEAQEFLVKCQAELLN